MQITPFEIPDYEAQRHLIGADGGAEESFQQIAGFQIRGPVSGEGAGGPHRTKKRRGELAHRRHQVFVGHLHGVFLIHHCFVVNAFLREKFSRLLKTAMYGARDMTKFIKAEHSVGGLVRAAREKRNLSQGEVSQASGVSRDYYRRVESGELPTIKTLVEIRDGLAMSRDEWSALLARFLVETGAAMTSEDTPFLDQVNRVANRDSATRARWIEETSENMRQMTEEQMEQFAQLSGFMVRYPVFFASANAMIALEAGKLPDASGEIPRRGGGVSATPGLRSRSAMPAAAPEAGEPVMAKLMKTKRKEKAVRS